MDKRQLAIKIATEYHKNQLYGCDPYIKHCLSVANIAEELGYSEEIIISCILHDILEDTKFTYTELKYRFGEEIAEIVYHVTDELGRNRKERKSKTYPKTIKLYKAVIVKICDRISNMEQSKKNNSTKYNMYCAELAEFYNSLNDKIHLPITHKAWSRLFKTLIKN